MYWRRSVVLKYAVAIFFGIVLHAEWLIYKTRGLFWTEFGCANDDPEMCTKILFIADPQIIGNSDYPNPFNYLIMWDSDRHLKNTFRSVVNYFKPDVLVFLGDLMNDGATNNTEILEGYVKRLTDLFQTDYDVLKVWVPGDTDLIGNGPGPMTNLLELERMLIKHKSVINFRNITFYTVNLMTYTYPQKTDLDDSYKIVLSHLPVLERYDLSFKIQNMLHPNVYFCGHSHESKYMLTLPNRLDKEVVMYYQPRTSLYIGSDDNIQYEIYVPSCSYMTTSNYIGYGAAVIETGSKTLTYTVFWSPERLPFIIIYAVLDFILIVYLIIYYKSRIVNQLSPRSHEM